MIDIAWLAQHGPCKRYSEGQIIPCPGVDSADSEKAMYILLGGRVDATGTGKKATQAISYFPGDVFGGEEYFTNKSERVYTAATDSVVYIVSESSFPDLSWAQPDIVFELLRASYIPQGKPTNTQPARTKVNSTNTSQSSGNKTIKERALENKASSETKTPEDPKLVIPALISNPIFPTGHKSYPGITKPEYERLVYHKDYTCPYCKQKFVDYRIFSSKLYEAAPMRYDMRRFYTDFQSEWYDIITCRYCYFSTVHSYYNETKPLLKQKIEHDLTGIRSSIFLDFDAERDIDFVFTTHYLALICSEGYLSNAPPLKAKIWGNLSWLYEDVEDKDMEIFAALKAAAAYEEVYMGKVLTPVQEQTTCLSIAGMQLRAGIDKDLRKYLYQVKTAKQGEKAYSILAEDLMEQLRVT